MTAKVAPRRATVASVEAELAAKADAATSIWIPADLMQLAQGSPSRLVIAATPVWSLPDANTGITTQLVLPVSWLTFDAELWWVNTSTTAGNVRLTWIEQAISNGSTLFGNFSTPVVVAATGQYVVVSTTVGGTRTAPAAGSVTQVGVARSGTHADDTLAASVGVVGLWLHRAS